MPLVGDEDMMKSRIKTIYESRGLEGADGKYLLLTRRDLSHEPRLLVERSTKTLTVWETIAWR